MKKNVLALAALVLATGCATIHQTATSTIAPDGTEERTINLRVTALGDAKQAVEKLSLSSGKTLSAGAHGANQETTSEALQKFLELLVNAAAKAKP